MQLFLALRLRDCVWCFLWRAMIRDTWRPSGAGFGAEELGSCPSYQSTKGAERSRGSIRNTEPISSGFHAWRLIQLAKYKLQSNYTSSGVKPKIHSYIYLCICITESLYCTPETNTLYITYISTKIKIKKKNSWRAQKGLVALEPGIWSQPARVQIQILLFTRVRPEASSLCSCFLIYKMRIAIVPVLRIKWAHVKHLEPSLARSSHYIRISSFWFL